ncbi:MAG: acyl-CoA dehydrogenase family protein, partial [Stellaceae bacterium]
MDFALSPEQQTIREAVVRVCDRFGDDYWSAHDRDGGFPFEFHRAIADGGWLGISVPEAYGGAGLGLVEAAIIMQAIAQAGAGLSGASAVHMNIFGLNPVVRFGTEAQKRRMLPPLVAGHEKACFAVTEPDAGLDTTRTAPRDPAQPTRGLSLFYTTLDRGHVEVREIDKMGRKAVDSNALFIDGLDVPVDDLIGEEGRGFEYLLHGLNPERVLIAAEAVGIGRAALASATRHAKERVVFGRPIGQ